MSLDTTTYFSDCKLANNLMFYTYLIDFSSLILRYLSFNINEEVSVLYIIFIYGNLKRCYVYVIGTGTEKSLKFVTSNRQILLNLITQYIK